MENPSSSYEQLVQEAITLAGNPICVKVKEGVRTRTTINSEKGIHLKGCYASPYFITDIASPICVLEDPYILLYDGIIETLRSLRPILECVAQSGISLFILAREYSEEVLKTLVVNKLHSTLKVGVAYLTLESDEYSDILLDVSMQTGSYLFTDERKLEQGKLEQLRKAKRIDISRDFIDIFGAQTETNLAQKHLRDLQMKLKSSDNEQTSRITERINALQTEFAMILTGGFSEGEIKESARAISAILSEIRDSNETFREDIP